MELHINGQSRSTNADPSMPLLWVLRDELNLTGTKFGCGVAACGACTVHVDPIPLSIKSSDAAPNPVALACTICADW